MTTKTPKIFPDMTNDTKKSILRTMAMVMHMSGSTNEGIELFRRQCNIRYSTYLSGIDVDFFWSTYWYDACCLCDKMNAIPVSIRCTM